MPIDRFIILLIVVIAAAGGTIYVAMALMGAVQLPALLGVGILSIFALCASFLVRRFSDQRHNKDS